MGSLWRTVGLLFLAATPLAAPLLAPAHPLGALLVRGFFSALCHQNPARSFWLQGSPAAVCVRCLGIYFGTVVGSLATQLRPSTFTWLAIAAAANGIDMLTGPNNLPLTRFALGGALGLAAGALLSIPLDRPRGLR